MAALTATTSTAPGRSAARLWRLGIVVAVLIAFGRASAADFVEWDDPFNLYENARLNPPTLAGVGHYWAHAAHGLYMPLTYTVWAALAALTNGSPDAQGISMNPWVFHGFNVLLHVLSALVAFTILTRFASLPAAAVGALVFALHPLQVEPVAWAAGTKDVLSGLLVLVALWHYIEFARGWQGRRAPLEPSPAGALREALNAPTMHALAHYLIALAAFILAMLAKPSAMVTPALALVIDAWLLRRPIRHIAAALAPWFLLSVGCALIARAAQVTEIVPAPLWARALIAGDALSFYLLKLIWPMNLAIDYGRRPAVVIGHWWFYLAWLIPALIALLLLGNRRRQPELIVAGAIFVVALSPVLGLVGFQFQYLSTVADHYVYVAMLGPALAAAWLADRASASRARGSVVAVSAAVLLALGVLTLVQAGVWNTSLALFSHAVSVNPRSTVCLTSLGRAWIRRGEMARAEAVFRQAIDVDADSWLARENLALVLEVDAAAEMDGGRTRRRAALERVDEAVGHRTKSLEVMRRRQGNSERAQIPITAGALARDLTILGRYAEALDYLQLTLKYRPDDPAVLAAIEEVKRQAGPGSTLPADRP